MSKVRQKNEAKLLLYLKKHGNDQPTAERNNNSGRKPQADQDDSYKR